MKGRKNVGLVLLLVAVAGSAAIGIEVLVAAAMPAAAAHRAEQQAKAEQSTDDAAQQKTALDFEEYRARVDEGLSQRPDVAELVDRLDAATGGIPSGDELVSEIERFLRSQPDQDE